MLRRRRELSDWPWERVMRQTVSCFTTNADEVEVRAAIVLHLDPDLLPKGWVERAAAAARDRGQEVDGPPVYLVACCGFAESDRYRLFMDLDRQHLIYDRRPAHSLDAAALVAREWVGDNVQERVFRELPGVFQAAYHDWLTGRRWDVDQTTLIGRFRLAAIRISSP
jgi:hypothetical protein